MKKRILSVLLTLCLLFCGMAVPVGAETAENVTVTVDPVYVTDLKVGYRIEVPVFLSYAEYGYESLDFSIEYPAEKLEFSKIIKGTAYDNDLAFSECKNGVVQYEGVCITKHCGENGPLFIMVFIVKDTDLLSENFNFIKKEARVFTDGSGSGNPTVANISVESGGFREISSLLIYPVNSDTETIGDTISIPFVLSNITYGYAKLEISVTCDPEVLEIVEVDTSSSGYRGAWLQRVSNSKAELGFVPTSRYQGGKILDLVVKIKNIDYMTVVIDDISFSAMIYTDDCLVDNEKTKVKTGNIAFKSSAAESIIEEINSIGDVTSESGSLIASARTKYNTLDDIRKKLVGNFTTLQQKEVAYAGLVTEKINAIDEVTLDSGDKIAEARNAYDVMLPEQRCLIENYSTLTSAEARYAELLADKRAADEVSEKINAIGKVTLDSEKRISEARLSYDSLTSAQREFVENYNILVESEKQLAKIKDDKAKADEVILKILAIGKVTLESENDIISSRTAYDALSDGAKALVSNYSVLTSAEQRLATIKSDMAAAEKVVEKINDIGTVTLYSESVIYAARNAYNALSDEGKGYVTNYNVLTAAERELTVLKDKAAAREVTDKINAIGTVTTEKESLIISARKAYDSLTDTQKNMVSNYQTLLQAEAQLEVIKSDKSAVDLVIGKILAIGKVTLESEDVITAARAAYDALTNEQKLSVTNYNVLLTAEATLQTIKQDADPGLRVVEKINQIGEVTLESGQLIQQARNAYDQLTTTQKSYVNNYDVLVAAETKYAQLKAYQDAIDDTINKINAIGEVTYQSGDAISAARNAFDALDYAQKAKIYNLETLLVAEIKYRDIKANYDAAVPVIEAIAKIENMNIDLDSGDRISSVKAKYDALSEEQKAYVSNYSVLTDAEAYFGAINDVYTKIRDIGKVTLEKISAVEQAREAYDALTTEQKDKITNYTVLVVSENSVLVLTCDKNKAEQVSEKIDEIENLPEADEQKPEISDENYEDIKARLDALEKLIDELIKKFATVEKDGKETVDEQKAEIVKETFYSEKVEKLKQAVEVYESVAVKYGDVNGDGKINTDDALLILQYVVGLSTIDGNGAKAADVNGDGRIDTNDALGILQYVVNIRTELPFEID